MFLYTKIFKDPNIQIYIYSIFIVNKQQKKSLLTCFSHLAFKHDLLSFVRSALRSRRITVCLLLCPSYVRNHQSHDSPDHIMYYLSDYCLLKAALNSRCSRPQEEGAGVKKERSRVKRVR